MKTIIEPFRIKMVEPIKLTTRAEREAILARACFNPFQIPAATAAIRAMPKLLSVGDTPTPVAALNIGFLALGAASLPGPGSCAAWSCVWAPSKHCWRSRSACWCRQCSSPWRWPPPFPPVPRPPPRDMCTIRSMA